MSDVVVVAAKSLVTYFVVHCVVSALYTVWGWLWAGQLTATDYFRLTGVPAPTPLLAFDIINAKPRPYRPFRWEYHQTMALQKMDPDWWLELESTYVERIKQRKAIHAKHGKIIQDSLPGTEPACRELMEMVIHFLCARYPNQFDFDIKMGVFQNHILKQTFFTRDIDPLTFLLENVPEDFLLVFEDKETGLYHLRAAVSCSAVGWNMAEKMGKPLHEIHAPVPDFKEKLQFSMDRYFSKMQCNAPIQRGSWSLEHGQPLFLQEGDPDWKIREYQAPGLRIEDMHLRVDWQTLRRIPKSRAIVFNFKAFFTPLTDFRTEPYIPHLLSKILREAKPTFRVYKNTRHTEHVILPALDKWCLEQEEKGWVPVGWKERTLDEHPYYPGWAGTE
ncbi:hypothetical protein BDN72DRAFT_842513 [Pluteus cervinus]|uniref:Uncharacterized protein n=1 Tax=Pluteus cervinus TaxID=181527 RepID=A0ACD3AQL1_9AGAR|nr:hypothetical protein BDN72DRAFT_842513 [Pluteus cervinus]